MNRHEIPPFYETTGGDIIPPEGPIDLQPNSPEEPPLYTNMAPKATPPEEPELDFATIRRIETLAEGCGLPYADAYEQVTGKKLA